MGDQPGGSRYLEARERTIMTGPAPAAAAATKAQLSEDKESIGRISKIDSRCRTVRVRAGRQSHLPADVHFPALLAVHAREVCLLGPSGITAVTDHDWE